LQVFYRGKLLPRILSKFMAWAGTPLRYFRTSPESVRFMMMLYIRFPLSLRNVENLLRERVKGIWSRVKTQAQSCRRYAAALAEWHQFSAA